MFHAAASSQKHFCSRLRNAMVLGFGLSLGAAVRAIEPTQAGENFKKPREAAYEYCGGVSDGNVNSSPRTDASLQACGSSPDCVRSAGEWHITQATEPENAGDYQRAIWHVCQAFTLRRKELHPAENEYLLRLGISLSTYFSKMGVERVGHTALSILDSFTRHQHPKSLKAAEAQVKVLVAFAEAQGSDEPLREAEKVGLRTLAYDHHASPLELAYLHNALGLTYLAYTAHNRGTPTNAREAFEKAASSFTKALSFVEKEAHPVAWTRFKANLASTFLNLGEQGPAPQALLQTIQLLQETMEVPDAELEYEQAGRRHFLLGRALSTLGEFQRNSSLLKKGITELETAAVHIPRQESPSTWALIQSSLGFSYGIVAELSDNTQSAASALANSVNAYRNALEEQKAADAPLDRATTAAQLGHALVGLSLVTGHREHAVAAQRWLQEALELYGDIGRPAFVPWVEVRLEHAKSLALSLPANPTSPN